MNKKENKCRELSELIDETNKWKWYDNLFWGVQAFISSLNPRVLWYKLVRLIQRIVRGWDDSETWDIHYQFLLWLQPRLKRFIKLTQSYPDGYNSYIEWIEELQYNECEYDFPETKYFNKKTIMQMFDIDSNKAESLKETNMKTFSYYCYQRDFLDWYIKNINNLWW